MGVPPQNFRLVEAEKTVEKDPYELGIPSWFMYRLHHGVLMMMVMMVLCCVNRIMDIDIIMGGSTTN